jgi:lipoprotein-anchoring transpeptidase ErfK/SrfK
MSDMLGGLGSEQPARRRSTARPWGWVAGVVAVTLLGTGAWLGLQPGAEADPPAVAATTASPSPSVSPSPPRPKPTPTPAAFSVAFLPTPEIDGLLPRALPLAKIETLRGLPRSVAVPTELRVPVWARPDVTKKPVLALESSYYDADARWLVLERRPGWVKVLIPYGRGALPSNNPEKVNGASGWLRAGDVALEQEKRAVVIDLSDRTVTLKRANGDRETFPATIGAPATPTPLGLTQVFTVTEAVNTGLSVFLSSQSEAMDTFYGNDYAATAIHVGYGQGQSVSNGCIRLTSADFEQLTGLDPGVPVLVKT